MLVGIVTLNRKEKLIKTLTECRRLGFADILVVDNRSDDGTQEYLRQQVGIRTIFSEKNDGGSGGFNRVMRYFVQNTSCQWLLMFDDDAWPAFSHSSLMEYLHSKDSPSAPAYAFRVTYPDGSLCEMNRPGSNALARNPLWHRKTDFHIGESTNSCPVDFAGFVGLMLKRETIEAVGIVSKKFFIYSDDTYYTLSISRNVGQLFYCPNFVIIHDCRRSSRNLKNHDMMRMERDVVNKIVMIREYSRFSALYIILYVIRLLFNNPKLSVKILRAAQKGMLADLAPYRNESL